jgi:hypothetical protein
MFFVMACGAEQEDGRIVGNGDDVECEPGAALCHVVAPAGRPIDVQCNDNLECHIECQTASSCNVDCGGSAECHVTCPPSGCAVTSCTLPDCEVTCGLSEVATYAGTTARCP